MISSISSQAGINLHPAQDIKAAAEPAPQQTSKTEDFAELSARAKSTLGKGDVDHDGDSH